jgi:hypothetical protein
MTAAEHFKELALRCCFLTQWQSLDRHTLPVAERKLCLAFLVRLRLADLLLVVSSLQSLHNGLVAVGVLGYGNRLLHSRWNGLSRHTDFLAT